LWFGVNHFPPEGGLLFSVFADRQANPCLLSAPDTVTLGTYVDRYFCAGLSLDAGGGSLQTDTAHRFGRPDGNPHAMAWSGQTGTATAHMPWTAHTVGDVCAANRPAPVNLATNIMMPALPGPAWRHV
jgi:hypothetical protein